MTWKTPRRVRAAARVYRALAQAFHTPTADLYQAAYLDQLRESLSAAGAPELVPLVAEMAEGLQDCPDLTALTVEHTRLFVGPGKLVAPPYESVYRGGGVLMGEPALAVLRRYEEAGVQLWEGFRDMPDHIAAELEYLYLAVWDLANWTAMGRRETASRWAGRYSGFLAAHPATWVEPFAGKVLAGSENRFYRALVELTAAWVKREGALVAE